MKKLFMLALIFLLAACAKGSRLVETKQENLRAFLFANDRLYLVGDLYDYEFQGEDVTKLKNFLALSAAKKVKSAKVNWVSIFTDSDSPMSAKVSYLVNLDSRTLTLQELKQLEAQGFSESRSAPYVDPDYLYFKYYYGFGHVTKLKNRDELLAKYAFKQPISVEAGFYTGTLVPSDDFEEGAEKTAEVIGEIISLPFYILCPLCYYKQ